MGVFIGHNAYLCWDFHAHSSLYTMQSAPWYTGILIYAIFTFIVLVGCIVGKIIIRKTKI